MDSLYKSIKSVSFSALLYILMLIISPMAYLHGDEIIIGTGTSVWDYPLSTYYHDARTQTIYLASEIGSDCKIDSLSLYVTTIPGQTMNNFTIRMKHTDMSSYGSSPIWESSGWTIVYQTNETIATTGWVQFDFSTSFTYNGTQNLMVDISFNNSFWTSDGYCRYSSPGGTRTIYYRTDSGYGDPLTWSGSTPNPRTSTKVPNIKLIVTSSVPTVDAGEDQITDVNFVQLDGFVEDDGLPDPPGMVTTTWSKVSGLGTVIFEPNEYVLNPIARFSALGAYVLKLTANDGELEANDVVTITYKQNEAPMVDAGIDRDIIDPIDGNSVNLSGQVSDDGLPKIPGYVTTVWSQVSGPGTVVFEPNEYELNPTARFSTHGEYVLKLTANDSELEANDTVIINYGVGWGYPLATSYHDARTQTIYLASEIGPACYITGLSLCVTRVPGQTLNNFTIRMKHTDLSSYNSTGWEYVDWTVVYQANKNIASTGWVQFDFTTPFVYNGTQNIMVDISFNNSSYTTDGLCTFSSPGGMRSIYYKANSTNGDPLTWSNRTPVPNVATAVPDIELVKASLPPTVEAGSNQITEVNYVQLDGSVEDDGLPDPPAAVTTIWSKDSGPGTVIFEPNEYVLNPIARFSTLGVYVLELTANDGEHERSDTVTITYKENDPPYIQALADIYIYTNTTNLSCVVTDDGLPIPPGAVSFTWSKVSGPGAVTFTPSADIPNPTAEFSSEGVYVLQLTADDGEYQVSDTMAVSYYLQGINPELIKVSSSSKYGDFANPDVNKIIDSSGLDMNGLHNNSFYDMCYIWDTTAQDFKYDNEIAANGKVWFAFEFNRAYTLNKLLLWNYNNVTAYGMKDITIAYSLDKDNWNYYSCQLAQANGTSESAQIVDIPNTSVKYVVIIASSNYQSTEQNKFGLSEVKFNYEGSGSTKATSPEPANNSTNPALDVVLSWMPVSVAEVVSHKVYISTSSSAVSGRTCACVNTSKESYTPSGLVAGTKYYWAVDEVDANGEVISGGFGDLWNFTVGAMEIRDVGVNGTLLGNIPVEKIQLDTGDAQRRCEAQVARTQNGDIYATLTATNRLYKSTDLGRTWTYSIIDETVIPLDRKGAGTEFAILEDDTFVILRVPSDSYDPETNIRTAVAVYRSQDYGQNWVEYSRIYANPFENINEGVESLTRLYDGTLLFPVARWSLNYSDPDGPWADRFSIQPIIDGRTDRGIFYSTDDGLSWTRVLTYDFVLEPQVIELHSGKLLGVFRYQRTWIPSGYEGYGFPADTDAYVTSLGGDPSQRYDTSGSSWGGVVFKNVFVGESFDNGLTWQNLHPVQDVNGSTLVIYGECHGQLVQVPDGRVVLVYDHRYPYSEYQVIARVSNDEGDTWEPEVYRVSMGDGYPSSVALKDGTIVTVTGNNYPYGSIPCTAQAVRWRLMDKETGTPTANLRMVRKYAIVGREVLFDASDSNDIENDISKYEWDFEGNYSFDYNETDVHPLDGVFDGKTKYVYTAAGEYNARVRVTDSNGLNDTYNLYHIIVSEDLDNDDMPDGWETRHGLDPNNPGDALIDSDGDGHSNMSEYLHQSNPYNDQSPPTPTTIFVPADIDSYQQAAGLAIGGDEIVLSSDLSNDGSVDLVDFTLFSQNWMDTNCGYCDGADFTGDENVDWEDLKRLAEDWLAGKI